jgi:IS6 family transposase
VAGVWQYAYRAIDEYGQVVDVYLSPTRDAEAAERFFRCAFEETGAAPRRVPTDKAACYPPALERVLPEVEHLTGKLIQQRIERDHQQLKGRTRPMRGFKTERGARIVCRGHGFLRNLRAGFYDLGGTVRGGRHRPAVRLSRAWEALTTVLLAA